MYCVLLCLLEVLEVMRRVLLCLLDVLETLEVQEEQEMMASCQCREKYAISKETH